MAIKTNTFTTFTNIGAREDLSDLISNISPTMTPLLTNAGSGPKAENTLFEWQTDSLAAVDNTNAKLEGEDYDSAGLQAATLTTRIGNYCQISAKTAIVSGTNARTKKAGRRSELAYQLSKRAAELKRDQEAILLANQAAVAGNTTTARKTGALMNFIKTNTSFGASGANPSYTNIPTGTRTDGTQRAFTETLLKTVMQLVYVSGGTPDTIMLGPVQKQTFSSFAGIAVQRWNVKSAAPSTVIGAVDVYVSDYGELKALPNRFQRDRDAFLLDFDLIEIRKFRDYTTEELARTGDAEKRLLLVEWGLCVKNEAGLGIVADLT